MLNFKAYYFVPFLCLFFIAGNCNKATAPEDRVTQDSIPFIDIAPKFSLPKQIQESSGVIYFDNAIWTHNDGGNKAVLYKLHAETGEVLKDITINDVENKDWEDISQDEEFIYISDAGNNAGHRKDLNIIKISKASLRDKDKGEDFSILDFSYEDQDIFSKRQYQHNFDCEAITVYKDHIILFTKNHKDYQCNWYQVDLINTGQKAKRINNDDPKGLITGVDYDPDQNAFVFCGYEKNKNFRTFQAFVIIMKLNAKGESTSSKKYYLKMDAQTEGICYKSNGIFFISSEKSGGKPGVIIELDANPYY
jgi:hypothetical protein